jgi:predicted site-specific integrase-resolvase
MMSTYNSAQCAKLAGVPVKTLQRWDREGRLKPAERTPGNRRLYTPERANQVLKRVSKTKPVTIATLRVSSQAQKPDLSNQRAALEQFCIARGIAEIGGGLNFKRPKFSDLVDRIIRSELSTLVIAHKDRLDVSGLNCWRIFARRMAARTWYATQSRSVLGRSWCKT